VAWQDLPERFGRPNSLYRRSRRWAIAGIWDELFTAGVPEDAPETVMVDATITKAQRFASGARGGGEEDLG
jgi:transposase